MHPREPPPQLSVTNTSADRRPDPVDWLFWAAVWLALVLVGVKAYYLGARGDLTTVELVADLGSLAAISYHDVAFAFAAWAIARAALVLGARTRPAGRVVVAAFMLFATLSCLYAIASVIAFGILGGFLTYALLQLVGNVRMLSSSVAAYLSRRVELGLVTVPLSYIGLVWLSTRVRSLARGPRWVISLPSNRMRPAFTGSSPNTVLNTVDLPAPFGPIIVVIAPRAARKLVPFRMVRSP